MTDMFPTSIINHTHELIINMIVNSFVVEPDTYPMYGSSMPDHVSMIFKSASCDTDCFLLLKDTGSDYTVEIKTGRTTFSKFLSCRLRGYSWWMEESDLFVKFDFNFSATETNLKKTNVKEEQLDWIIYGF